MASGIGVGAALLGAIYVGLGLESTVQQRTQALTEQRIAQAFRFMERWNDPRFADIKERFRTVLENKIRNIEAGGANPMLRDSSDRHTCLEMFNFFEEMALSIRSKISDEETLLRLFRGLVVDFYGESARFVKEIRGEPGGQKTFIESEWLYDQWKNK